MARSGRLGELERLFIEEPDVLAAIKRIKRYPGGYKTTAYDISDKCNLKCEGCFYFTSEYGAMGLKQPSENEYRRFFAQEIARGVNVPVFCGAEPSLRQGILHVAREFWSHGVITTNGLVPIEKEIDYRILISSWGGEDEAADLRGNDDYKKIMASVKGDERVTYMYTFSKKNIEAAYTVARDCFDNGVQICFSQYSPTEEYLRRLKHNEVNDRKFFRISGAADNLTLTPEDRIKINKVICDLIDLYPKTVIYSKNFSKWVTKTESLYETNSETGMATNCATLNAPYHKHFLLDFTPYERKLCATPALDCSQCRVYPSAFAQYLSLQSTRGKDNLRDWLEVRDTLGRLYFHDWDK